MSLTAASFILPSHPLLEARNKGTKHVLRLWGSSVYNLGLTADKPAIKIYYVKSKCWFTSQGIRGESGTDTQNDSTKTQGGFDFLCGT